MKQYHIAGDKPNTHYLSIEVSIETEQRESLTISLPVWRPGRYELGNFAKNIKNFRVENKQGHPISYKKTSKSSWEIETKKVESIVVKYDYYAFEMNAGSSFLDDDQLYINPVNCCVYDHERMNEQHLIRLLIPEDYKTATSLKKIEEHAFIAKDFHELADSPIIASRNLISYCFEVENITTHIHLNGGTESLAQKMIPDFRQFMQRTKAFFGHCPVSEFHFMFQILPYRFYHGVEHLKSTIIAIGPYNEVENWSVYSEILGVSCHEFFHVWNIKHIRPKEMLPYDYQKENYSQCGFVYEGFTTYYGDLLLLQSGVFSESDYFATLADRINRHAQNYGRFNLSLAEASYDTWLDGYVPGVPQRKVSIYDEGNLFAFLLDIHLIKSSGGKKSLRDICIRLLKEFGDKNIGYSEKDIIRLANETANEDLTYLFENFLYKKSDYLKEVEKCLNEIGLQLINANQPASVEQRIGVKTSEGQQGRRISMIAPDSPAERSGLSILDEIISINNNSTKTEYLLAAEEVFQLPAKIEFTISRGTEAKSYILEAIGEKNYFPSYYIESYPLKNNSQEEHFKIWSGIV